MPPRSQSLLDWSRGSCSIADICSACWTTSKRRALRVARNAVMRRSGELMESSAVEKDAGAWRRRMLVLVPLVAFLALAILFVLRLGAGDPSRIPSALIGHPAPRTDLPPLPGLERDGKAIPGLDSAEFQGHVTVLNVWASWCVPCREEAALLMTIAADLRLRVVGMNYKDQADNARRFLGRYGNPFVANGTDGNGRAAIEWGVYGVPETFVIGRDGRIAYKLIGPITPDNLRTALQPAIEKALAHP